MQLSIKGDRNFTSKLQLKQMVLDEMPCLLQHKKKKFKAGSQKKMLIN